MIQALGVSWRAVFNSFTERDISIGIPWDGINEKGCVVQLMSNANFSFHSLMRECW